MHVTKSAWKNILKRRYYLAYKFKNSHPFRIPFSSVHTEFLLNAFPSVLAAQLMSFMRWAMEATDDSGDRPVSPPSEHF